MLAALIATRSQVPPKPPVLFYSNQFVAAVNTFVCVSVCRAAGAICTSRPIQNQLLLSVPGRESFLDQLNRLYYTLLNFRSSDANVIGPGVDPYLSNQILAVINSVTSLTPVLASLPVSLANVRALAALQARLAVALANLQALGKPAN